MIYNEKIIVKLEIILFIIGFISLGAESLSPIGFIMCNILYLHIFSHSKDTYQYIMCDYPIEKCITPKYFKKAFNRITHKSDVKIPKEIYYMAVFHVFSYYFLVIVLMLSLPIHNSSEFRDWIIFIYLSIIGFLVCFFLFRAVYIGSKRRYKKMNRYNFLHYFDLLPEREREYLGKCVILNEYKKKKEYYADVEMVKTGERFEKVLFSSGNTPTRKKEYSLYEICHVKYISL